MAAIPTPAWRPAPRATRHPRGRTRTAERFHARRLIASCAFVLALITGAWFGQAYVVFAPLEPIPLPEMVDDRSIAAELAVWAFYDAVTDFLATGDEARIRAVVAANFVDEARPPGSDTGRDGLVSHLHAIRRDFPRLQLEPTEVIGHGDTVAVRLEVAAGAAVPFLGMTVVGARPWGTVELFRVVADQIVARWGDPSGYPLLQPIAAEVFAAAPFQLAVPTMTRRSYAPGVSDWAVPSWGPVLMIAESGSVIVNVAGDVVATVLRAADRSGGDPASGGQTKTIDPVTLTPGDVLTVMEPAKVETRNDAEAPATVLVLTLAAPHAGDPVAAPPQGLHTATLAGGSGRVANAGTVAVAVGRAVLAPGTGLAPHMVAGQELALVEHGDLALQIDSGRAWARHPDGTLTAARSSTALPMGTGLCFDAGAVAAYRNDGAAPLALLLVKVYVTAHVEVP